MPNSSFTTEARNDVHFKAAFTSGHMLPGNKLLYPLVDVNMLFVSATKLLPVYCPSVAGVDTMMIQVDRDINK